MPAHALPHAPGRSSAAPEHLATLPAHLAHWAHHTPGRRAFTFADHTSPGLSGSLRTLTWHRLDIRTRAVAARLAETVAPGERVALLTPQGTDYVIGFLAALRAGIVAVPLFTPDLPGHADRLAGVLADARPSAVLTTSGAADSVRAFLDAHDLRPSLVVTDLVPDDRAGGPLPPAPDERTIAYLQYTSGSTRFPTGVEISHANVVANARQALTAYGVGTPLATTVGWLPLYHDMGLVLSVAAPVVGGLLSVLMDPVAFLQRPARWLRLLSDHPGTLTAAPNFAYDYCAAVVTDEDKAGLRLDRVAVLVNGSEPVRPQTVDRFHAAFAEQGLPVDVHCPSYGLAEATVFVSAHRPGQPLSRYALDREALAAGKALLVAPDDPAAVLLAACGESVGQSVHIVDPATAIPLPAGEVGEIWVQGPNVGRGYAGSEPQTRETFHARLGRLPGHWLRTGDLGTMLDGQLLVTGRLKDLIIVDGRNHYPQDVEATAQAAHRAIRPDRLAAFAVPADHAPGGGAAAGATIAAERAVVVAEYARGLSPQARDHKEVAAAVRAAVSARHGLRLTDVLLVPPGAVPRTSSGKVSRTLTRSRYLDGFSYSFERGLA
ncbi:fatty acyl-AMP ligase [Streptomyces sp. SID12488]|uniref:fatty acyl-AMP ligase n=1 Tax=Streptomyces sp. SID12488 TaxID=2706040 RepID=UPI0013DC2475|nr:fatty acyl-AMP ligase [Streptomyces sp. SID12488]NEA66311.1 fatty acyl-AMP ligase [Streptomyces sp. SID12488]